MNNVVNIANYATLMDKRRAQDSVAVAGVLSFEPPMRTDREAELAMLLKVCAALLRAKTLNDADEIAEARDDLEVMALHTDFPDIRYRTLQALNAVG